MTNFDKLLKSDKDNLLKAIANNICIDIKNCKVNTDLNCSECDINNSNSNKGCNEITYDWLKKEYIPSSLSIINNITNNTPSIINNTSSSINNKHHHKK
jgi:hypothetical protein